MTADTEPIRSAAWLISAQHGGGAWLLLCNRYFVGPFFRCWRSSVSSLLNYSFLLPLSTTFFFPSHHISRLSPPQSFTLLIRLLYSLLSFSFLICPHLQSQPLSPPPPPPLLPPFLIFNRAAHLPLTPSPLPLPPSVLPLVRFPLGVKLFLQT